MNKSNFFRGRASEDGPEHSEHRGRHGRHRGHHEHHELRVRGRMARFFEHGDLRLVVLKLIADRPRHGYELIKDIEQAAGGAYSPSPGVIYPTLTLLEELGHVTVSETEGTKKLYTLSPEGEAMLKANAKSIDALFARLDESATRSAAFAPQIMRARENFKTALRLKLTGEKLTDTQINAIAAALDAAAQNIEQI